MALKMTRCALASGMFGKFLEFAEDFAAILEGFVFRHKGFEIHAHPLGGQIAHVAHGGFDDVIVAQVLVDGLGFGRRFDDDQMFEAAFIHAMA